MPFDHHHLQGILEIKKIPMKEKKTGGVGRSPGRWVREEGGNQDGETNKQEDLEDI